MTSKFEAAGAAFSKLCETIAALRHPITGCPWDLAQTHASLRRYMIEEAYEACEVMDPLDSRKLKEELGDVLLQVVLNSQLGSDAKEFAIKDVIESIDSKMIRRHPHVFGTEEEKKTRDQDSIREKWIEIKSSENKNSKIEFKKSVFDEIAKDGTPPSSLKKAVAIGKIAKKIRFDWESPKEVFAQVKSELLEVEQELLKNPENETSDLYEEIGDLFFSLAQFCRHLDIDPEICVYDGNKKFLNRFETVEKLCIQKGVDVYNTDASTLNTLWIEAKQIQKSNKHPKVTQNA